MAKLILERADLIRYVPENGGLGYGIVTSHDDAFLIEGNGEPGCWTMRTDWIPRNAYHDIKTDELPHEVRLAIDAVRIALGISPLQLVRSRA